MSRGRHAGLRGVCAGTTLAAALTVALSAVALSTVAFGPLAVPVPAQAQLLNDAPWDGARAPAQVEVSLEEIAPINAGEDLRVRLRLHNKSAETASELQVTARRGDAVPGLTEARMELAAGQFPYFGATAQPEDLGPGESTTVEMTVPTALGAEQSLAVTQPGEYPVMFALTGVAGGAALALGDDRVILPVGAPASDTADSPAPGATSADAEQVAEAVGIPATPPRRPHALTLIYPLTAHIDIVPGETGGAPLLLQSEQLANQLAPEGRLSRLLDEYLSHDLQGAGCVALDPAVLDTVERMAGGYRVTNQRPSIARKPQRLRDSWTRDRTNYDGVAGTGAADARAFLDKIHQLDCTLAMPWANTNTDAVSQAHNSWLLHEAIGRGAETLRNTTGMELTSAIVAPGAGYVTQPLETTTLVADNTQWPGQAVTFNASLAALLAATGPAPETPGYSNPQLRFDYQLDSAPARNLSAVAALRLALAEGDTVAKLPHNLDPDAARALLGEAAALLAATDNLPGTTQPSAYPQERAGVVARGIGKLKPQRHPEVADGQAAEGSPFPDPAQLSVPDVQAVEQQARYADELTRLMVNDPNIAMTRYDFTLPLRRDLLTTLSMTGRSARSTHADAVAAANLRRERNSAMLQELRASVALLPPGNVFTRASESSPLLIVAENNLPLPVEATLRYSGPEGTVLHTPEVLRIPAQGSITTSLTADLPADAGRTTLRLWLATADNSTVSAPVIIAVSTQGGKLVVYGLGVVVALLALAGLGLKLRRNNSN
ncbi:hypothetical protein [Corynebacterium lizhenjunii]|uniref:hypothetical protein n=1 Tax=Corynebacterium lizhenjunii TaxID=2709394 RepID=UPI001FD5A491|nr:hypothetical protein [Corynebacterium lizhenjunii]